MRFLLLTIVILGLYPVMRVALGLCRLICRASPRTSPSPTPEVERVPTAGTDENNRGERNALTAICPYCREIQDPPPKRKKKCSACGKPIRAVTRGGHRKLPTEDAYARLVRQETKARARALRQSSSKARRADLRRMRDMRPLPQRLTWAPVPRSTSPQSRPISSETRRPVCTKM